LFTLHWLIAHFQFVFVGTTNEDQFLADSTGNRRWLPIRVGDVSVDAIKRDVLQLWAEGALLFKENGVMFDSASRLAISEHAEYEFIDSWLHQINPITQERPIDQDYIVSQDVLVKGLGYEPRNILRRDEMRVANVLKAMGYMRRQICVDGNRKHVFAKVNTDDV
jgi:predicted P-loop ATPase